MTDYRAPLDMQRAPMPHAPAGGAHIDRIRQFVFLAAPILYVIQNPTFREYDDIQSGIKPHHGVALILFLIGAYRAPARSWLIAFILMVIAAITTLSSGLPILNTRVLNGLMFLMAFLGAAGADGADRDMARKGAGWACVLIAVTTLWQLPTIISTAASNIEGRSLYPTIMSGGINIQASTFIILYAFSVSAAISPLLGAVALTFLLTQTRAIFLVLPATLIDNFARRSNARQMRRNAILFTALIAVTIPVATSGMFDVTKILERLSSALSGDAGTEGRSMLLYIAGLHSDCFSLGCGLGSASEFIALSAYSSAFEDNFHNVYVQMLTELGTAGFISYSLILISAYRFARSKTLDKNLSVAILATIIMNLVEFNGFEFLTAFLAGMAFSLTGVGSAPVNHSLR